MEHDLEARLEAAYWEFDCRRNRQGEYAGINLSHRDDFKATLRGFVSSLTRWKPISAAPKDGTPIVGVIEGRDDEGKPFIPFVCWWYEGKWEDGFGYYYPTHFVLIQTPPAKEGEDNV